MLVHHGREELLLIKLAEDYSAWPAAPRGINAKFDGRFRCFLKARTCHGVFDRIDRIHHDFVNHENSVNPVQALLLGHLCELVGEGVHDEFETIGDSEF